VRSGVEVVDHAIELVTTGDAEGLAALAVLESRPCVLSADHPEVICPDGVEAGTSVEAFAYANCSGEFVHQDLLLVPFEGFLSLSNAGKTVAVPLRLYSVEQIVPAPATDRGAYVLHFAFPDGAARHLPLRADGRIPTLSLGCFNADPIERHATTEHEWLLPPPS
jgi:hypothetical protein